MALANLLFFLSFPGAETQNRTGDTGIFSPLLYRLSYLGMTLGEIIVCALSEVKIKLLKVLCYFSSGSSNSRSRSKESKSMEKSSSLTEDSPEIGISSVDKASSSRAKSSS